MKYLAATLAIVEQARARGMIRTVKIDEILHPADIPTKPLQRREFVYKRARVLGLEGGVPPPPECQPKEAASAGGAAQESATAHAGLAARHRTTATSAGADTAARYKQPALSPAPWRGRKKLGRADRHERGRWGHALSRAGLTARPASRGAPNKTCHGGG